MVVPVIIYNRTNVILNGKSVDKNEMKRTSIGALVVTSNTRDNTLKISYQTPKLLIYSIFIVLISFILVMIYMGYRYFFYKHKISG